MPQYDYKCPTCEHTEERIHSIHDCDKEQLCPNEHPMERVLQPMAASQVQLLGYWETRDGYTSLGTSIKG